MSRSENAIPAGGSRGRGSLLCIGKIRWRRTGLHSRKDCALCQLGQNRVRVYRANQEEEEFVNEILRVKSSSSSFRATALCELSFLMLLSCVGCFTNVSPPVLFSVIYKYILYKGECKKCALIICVLASCVVRTIF